MSIQDLDQRFPIVMEDGRASDYLMRVLRDRGLAQTDVETAVAALDTRVTADEVTLAAKADKIITISSGTGLSGGGDLSANRIISLANTAVTPGSYTNTNLTVDAQGRITSAANGTGGGATTSSPLDPASFGVNNANGAAVNYNRYYLLAGTVVTGAKSYPNGATTLNLGAALYGPIGSASQIVTGVALVASSSIASNTVTAGSTVTIPFTSPYTVLTTGYYYLAYNQSAALAHLCNSLYFNYFGTADVGSFSATTKASAGSTNRVTANWY